MEFNIKDIFEKAFGYSAPDKFDPPPAESRVLHSELGSNYYGADIFGREYFLPVTINGLVIPFAVVSVNCRKSIVETQMVERSGSVKELISIDDYVFNVKGILISEDGNFPEQQIINIHELFKLNTSVTMRSVLTDIFLNGIVDHSIVIKELKWPAKAAVEHAKPFEMDCVSDSIFTLEV